MNNIWIVIGREYMTRVKKKSFLILTILMPFLIVGISVTPMLLGSLNSDNEHVIAIVDNTGEYAPLFEDGNNCRFIVADKMNDDFKEEGSDVEAVLTISANLADNPDAARLYSHSEIQSDVSNTINDILTTKIHRDKLERYNVPQLDSIISDVQQNYRVKTVKWSDDGSELVSDSNIAMLFGLLSALLIYMFVMSYGGMVMSSVMEEKTNRIVEVIVSSVKPFQLMMGKLVAVLLVGLTQMLIWTTMLLSLFAIAVSVTGASMVESSGTVPTLPGQSAEIEQMVNEAVADNPMAEILGTITNLPLAEMGILFLIFFLGGYLLYASFYAAIGASVNSQEDSSQFMLPMILVMVFALYAAMGSMENTNGPLAFWTSMFPLTSPIVMMMRIPFGVPLWEELLSVVILYATALFFVWISSRIYRVGILMYGKKPTIKEMIKWMRYK